MSNAALASLLATDDPPPVEILFDAGDCPALLVCEHAGRAVPACLGDLGLPGALRNSHIGWDIGAEDVARAIARQLDAPLVLQRYSRLVIDSNRPPGSATSIPMVSAGIGVPGNSKLTDEERTARRREIFDPLNNALTEALLERPFKALFSIHSYTPTLDGQDRPWHAGFLTRTQTATAQRLMESIATARPDLKLALNQPYRIEDETDWFIPAHAERLGLPHCLIEIRNDQVDHPDGVALWATLLANAIQSLPELRP